MASFALFGSPSSSSSPSSAPAPNKQQEHDGSSTASPSSSSTSAGWLSSISSYIGSSIASVASPNASSYDDTDDDDNHSLLVLPKNEELADIAEGDEEEPSTKLTTTQPLYKTDDKGRKLLILPPGAHTTDPLEANTGPTESVQTPTPSAPTDPAAAAQGYSNPAIFPNGSSFTSSNEPLNVIISSHSSPDVLTRKGLQSYLRSINFDFECLDLHSGGPQYATVDATGQQAQVFEYRDVLTPLDHIFGTCIESLLGGNHVRGYQQQLTNAWFLAVSTEENVTQGHTIKPDGYNLGRDDLVQRSQSQPNAQTDFFFQAWRTSVTWVTGLIPIGATANHDITVDGKTAVLTITAVNLLGLGQSATSTTATTAAPPPAAAPAAAATASTSAPPPSTQPTVNSDATTVAPAAAAAGGGVTAAAVATAPGAAEEASAPLSRKPTDKPNRPSGKRFSFGLKRRLSAQISKSDADKVLAEVEADEQQKKAAAAAAAAAAEEVPAPNSAPLPGRASFAASERKSIPKAVEEEAAAAAASGEQSITPLEVPKLKRRESGLKKLIGRVQQGRKSSAGNHQRSASGTLSSSSAATPGPTAAE